MTPAPGAPLPRSSSSPIVLDRPPAPDLPIEAVVNGRDGFPQILKLLARERFTSGREPFARHTYLENVRPHAALRPAGGRLIREVVTDHARSHLVTGEGWSLGVVHNTRHHTVDILVTATSAETVRRVLDGTVADAVEPVVPSPDVVPVEFWHLSTHGPVSTERQVDAPSWAEIRGHYPASVATSLAGLAGTTADDVTGRLLLLHGPPGTGKTTLLRALAREWRDWCQVDCVLDPEALFGATSYLLEVALGERDEDDERPWRMLLLEDCDELIRGGAKATAGQNLSRLLNLTDGLLGQGRRVIVAITTNEDLSALHPAVTRPGRCLARVEVGRFPPEEATAWLGTGHPGVNGVGPAGATLAELFALRSGDAPSTPDGGPAPGTGMYL